MNTNPVAKVILCFGDSNTHGASPDGTRYAADVRWTGQLQQLLGNDYYVVEEGLGGRTTDLDDERLEKFGRNGFAYFKPALETHAPVHAVLIMLGTNDEKLMFNRSVTEIASALRQYCQYIKAYDSSIKIVLIAPAQSRLEGLSENYDASSVQKSVELPAAINQIANDENVLFFDANSVAQVGTDGLHWDQASHQAFAAGMDNIVRQFA